MRERVIHFFVSSLNSECLCLYLRLRRRNVIRMNTSINTALSIPNSLSPAGCRTWREELTMVANTSNEASPAYPWFPFSSIITT